ncbi:hypothetical protein FQZ97_780790 [compost metagenome]
MPIAILPPGSGRAQLWRCSKGAPVASSPLWKSTVKGWPSRPLATAAESSGNQANRLETVLACQSTAPVSVSKKVTPAPSPPCNASILPLGDSNAS